MSDRRMLGDYEVTMDRKAKVNPYSVVTAQVDLYIRYVMIQIRSKQPDISDREATALAVKVANEWAAAMFPGLGVEIRFTFSDAS